MEEKKINKGLTSFRAFAFLAVYFYHLNYELIGGYLGVQAFFVLSGFLITPILFDMKREFKGWEYLINFYGRRALRILPLYYLFLVIAAVFFYVVGNNSDWADNSIVSNEIERESSAALNSFAWLSVYAGNFVQATADWKPSYSLAPLWSLAVEEQFYLFWPLVVLCVPRRFARIFLILAMAAGPIFRFTFVYYGSQGLIPNLNQDRLDLALYVLPFTYIDAFAIGGFFAMYLKSYRPSFAWLAIIIVLGIGFITESRTYGEIQSISTFGYAPFMSDSLKYLWGYTLVSVLFALILLQVREGKFLRPVFEHTVIHYMGKISYGLYIFHALILKIVYLLMPTASNYIVGLIAFPFIFLVSTLSYELMEKRIVHLKNIFFPSSRAAKKMNSKSKAGFVARLLYFMPLGLNIIFVGAITLFIYMNFAAPLLQDDVDKSLETLSLKLNKQLPTMTSADTRLDSTIAGRKSFTYRYTLIRAEAANINIDAVTLFFKPKLLENFCNSSDMAAFRQNNIRVNISYSGNDGEHVTNIPLHADMCESNTDKGNTPNF